LHGLPVSDPTPVAEFLFQQITKINKLSNAVVWAATTYGNFPTDLVGQGFIPQNRMNYV
jgi:hypothetical protein